MIARSSRWDRMFARDSARCLYRRRAVTLEVLMKGYCFSEIRRWRDYHQATTVACKRRNLRGARFRDRQAQLAQQS
jgi:hypothetical protein